MKNAFNKSALILAAGLTAGLFASASFAADTGAMSREQVRAEYNQARANGTLPAKGEGQTAAAPKVAPSTLTREAVRADYYAARAAGTLPANGEAQEVRQVAAPVTVSREAVRAEYFAARRAGTLPLNGERG
jgi:Domain of unknown function (DUF4148)